MNGTGSYLTVAATLPSPQTSSVLGLRAADPIAARLFATLRRRALLTGCKWDPQVGDTSVLSPFPVVIKASVWRVLASLSERLAAEAVAAEEEILRQPRLLRLLGLPATLRRIFEGAERATPTAGRVLRFDFHPTTEGWRISEANSDVPGGFAEASYFTDLLADQFPELSPAGSPGRAWCDALAAKVGSSGVIALLSSPGYMEDHQVIAFLAQSLRERGCSTHLAKPEQIIWRDGWAHLESSWYRGSVDAIVRFYQAEWISRLARESDWPRLFRGGKTPVASPAAAVISESKRFPLTWPALQTPLPTWRAFLPESRDPRHAPWSRDDGWLLKPAFCNTGDTIISRHRSRPDEWRKASWAARFFPHRWVAQRKFESIPISTPAGSRHVCIGVYAVNGRAAGAYTRLSRHPVIDYQATDAALLIEQDD